MTVEEVQALADKAKVHELHPEAKYLVLIDPMHVSMEQGHQLAMRLREAEIKAVVMFVGQGVSIYEVKP